ncbi:MAG: hypothetical protein AVDCRST_MAG13-2607 [uncultured Solirubrobacteraceae bacterium]|uniref:CBS domain-containing protein n=1 Tax=uncultured Solirubrobacteraceae bacterium TaxID=1162706 RepID=A0A6J4SWW2_9ACTN|nr:MAG: hypothetical protein AVDCRST_MAG13-2607 [uncultured Solirubrobacteraceae bacterium]
MRALIRDVPILRTDDSIAAALQQILETELPALPVSRPNGRYAGVFGEREFLAAIFPRYLGTLSYAGFLSEELDEVIEQNADALDEPLERNLNTEHVDLDPHAADASLAEVFLHHRVLIVPVVDQGRIIGIVRRSDFFRELARRALEARR